MTPVNLTSFLDGIFGGLFDIWPNCAAQSWWAQCYIRGKQLNPVYCCYRRSSAEPSYVADYWLDYSSVLQLGLAAVLCTMDSKNFVFGLVGLVQNTRCVCLFVWSGFQAGKVFLIVAIHKWSWLLTTPHSVYSNLGLPRYSAQAIAKALYLNWFKVGQAQNTRCVCVRLFVWSGKVFFIVAIHKCSWRQTRLLVWSGSKSVKIQVCLFDPRFRLESSFLSLLSRQLSKGIICK